MKNPFKKASAPPLSEAEQALKSWGIKYKKQPDGSILILGNLDLSNKGLTKLPDLSSVTVGGNFYCHDNQLTSLEGAPATVGGDFSCSDNQLTSLEHAPQSVTGSFSCHNNQLTSLEHAPQSVSGGFYCSSNQLTSLEHAPQIFMKLKSDFGEYSNWEQVPENLRVSPETKARLEQEQIAAATVLQAPIKVSAPLKLRSKAPSLS